MNMIHQYPVDAVYLRAAVQRDIAGEVDYITGTEEGWTVHLRDAEDLPACTVETWAGLPVRYEAFPSIAAIFVDGFKRARLRPV